MVEKYINAKTKHKKPWMTTKFTMTKASTYQEQWTKKMAQWIKVLTTKPDDLNSIAGTHMVGRT